MMINTNYGKKTLAVILLWLFSMTILIGCASSNMLASTNSPEPTPTATPSIAPTPTAVITPEPTATPTPLLELSYEEESKIIGYDPTIKEFMAAAVSGIYYEGEVVDENGKNINVRRIAFVYLKNIPESKHCGIHIIFNDMMIFQINTIPASYYIEQLPRMDVTASNENLKSVKIVEGFEINEIEKFCKNREIPFKDNDALDKIRNYIETNGLQSYVEDKYILSTKDFLEIYLSIPKEFRVPVSELR